MPIKSEPKFDTPMQDFRTLNTSIETCARIYSLGINGINAIITHMPRNLVNIFLNNIPLK